MSDNGRLSLVFLFNILLYFFIGLANNIVSGWSITLHLDALLLIFFALYVTRLSGLVFAVILGLVTDSVHPVPAGTYLIGYLAMWLFFTWCQRRIRRQNPLHVRTVAVAAQIAWIVFIGLFLGRAYLAEWVYWQRLLTDMLVSCTLLFLIVWPWCRFQKKLLYSLGWDLEAQISHL
jgi:cell shape-determining protein MreD